MTAKHNTGFIFAVLYTEDGTAEGKHLGYQVVLSDFADENHRVIVHNEPGEEFHRPGITPIADLMTGSLNWACGKYPDYVVDKVRLRKGPMPMSEDEANAKRHRIVAIALTRLLNEPEMLVSLNEKLGTAVVDVLKGLSLGKDPFMNKLGFPDEARLFGKLVDVVGFETDSNGNIKPLLTVGGKR